jgi:type I restriction enzyme S subunit
MSSDWKVALASHVCGKHKSAMSTGPFGSAISSRFFVDSGVPVIRGSNLSQDVGTRFNHDDLVFIAEDKASEFERSTVRRGDLIFTCWGTIDQVGLIDEGSLYREYVISNKQMKMTPDPAIADSRFLYYQFSSPKIRSWIIDNGIGSSVPGFNLGMLKSVELIIPPLPEQKAIAHLLGTLDDKIELNRKTNETLEAMAKALFQSWFVDFDPVRAKAEGRPTGLPDEISELFPDSFEDSDLGEIPRGWRDGEIQDVAELNPETWGSKNQPSRVRYLDLSNVKYGKIDCVEEYEWEFAPSRAKRVLKTGDTVVGTVRPGNGSYCLIGEDGITGSTGFAVLRPKNKNDDVFVYLGSCSKENIDRLAHLADGGAYPAVRPELIAKTPVVVATREVLDCFSIRVSPLFAASEKGRRESKVLCQVRDTLLPKLISGELRIPEAEKLVSDLR